MPDHRPPRLALLLMLPLALALAVGPGCGYTVRPPFNKDVRTVYVPIFRSITFRKDLNLQLTKRIQDEIQNRTPFRVVGSPEGADTTLEGTITFADKNAILESPNNLPRQVQDTILCTVRWVDNRSSKEKQLTTLPVVVVENANAYNELGETSQLGFDKAIDKLARQVVGMMEEPW